MDAAAAGEVEAFVLGSGPFVQGLLCQDRGGPVEDSVPRQVFSATVASAEVSSWKE
jgi:hypothetical protein